MRKKIIVNGKPINMNIFPPLRGMEGPTNIRFENRYGSCLLQTVGCFMPVKEINSSLIKHFNDIETSEKIALITENELIQQCYASKLKKMYIVLHSETSRAAICRIISVNFTDSCIPEQEIERLNKIEAYKMMPYASFGGMI